MRASGHLKAASALLLALGVAGCDPDIPTSPGGATSPRITSVVPQAPLASPAPQTLTIRGERFLTGLELAVASPSGATQTISGSAIQQLQSTSFQTTVVLNAPGTYSLTIRNTTGDLSEPFALAVQGSPGETVPFINAVVPGSVTRSATPQTVTVQGGNFVAGLSVQITEPDGVTTFQSGGAISGLTSTSFLMTMTFGKVGIYTLRVSNPSGEASNVVNVVAVQ